jgi:hypothetical protein
MGDREQDRDFRFTRAESWSHRDGCLFRVTRILRSGRTRFGFAPMAVNQREWFISGKRKEFCSKKVVTVEGVCAIPSPRVLRQTRARWTGSRISSGWSAIFTEWRWRLATHHKRTAAKPSSRLAAKFAAEREPPTVIALHPRLRPMVSRALDVSEQPLNPCGTIECVAAQCLHGDVRDT